MTERVVIVGAGGFGRETLDVFSALATEGSDIDLVGVLDSGPRREDLERLTQRGVPFLGAEAAWLDRPGPKERFVAAVGAPRLRRLVAERFESAGFLPISLIHPRAVLGSCVTVGPGAVVSSGVQVSTNVSLGAHVHLNPGSIIGHDVVLGDFVSVNPGAIVSGDVRIGAEALIGAGSVVLQGLDVGVGATVGAAACVTKSVGPGLVVKGVPAS